MPGPVTDRPKAHIPEGPVDEQFVEGLSLPTAGTGYRRSQVDALLAAHVAGAGIEPGTRFDVVRKGYDMQAVDAVIERMNMPVRPEVVGDVEAQEGNAALLDDRSAGEPQGATSKIDESTLSEETLRKDADQWFLHSGDNPTEPSEESERAARRGLPTQ